MVNKYSLDEKLKERENEELFKTFEESKHFLKFVVRLIEGILNYNYDDLHTYFEGNIIKHVIEIYDKVYSTMSGTYTCRITACVNLHDEDYAGVKLKVTNIGIHDKFGNYSINVDKFIYTDTKDDNFIDEYKDPINSTIFKEFKYNWSINKDKIFKRVINDKNITPSECIVNSINDYIYNEFIHSKSKMNYREFINSEFKFDVDKKTQRIRDKYFFNNIPNIKRRIITNA